MIIVSHTSKQGNVYERAVAAVERKETTSRFLTGLYADCLPGWLRLLARYNTRARSFVELTKKKRAHHLLRRPNVVSTSGVWAEFIRLGFRKIRWSDNFHDFCSALWLLAHFRKVKGGIFHGFQDSCTLSVFMARKLGAIAVVEVILPPIRPTDCTSDEFSALASEIREKQARISGSLLRQIEKADFALVQSDFGTAVLQELGVPSLKIVKVDLGVDVTLFSPGPRAKIIGGNPLKLLFVGQIGFRKGIDLLVRALEALPKGSYEITLAGHVVDDVGRDAVLSLPEGSYRGVVSDEELLRLYQTSDYLVIPSRAEGGCNVVMESLSCGTPCIVSDGARSVIEDGIDGWIVPNNDSLALQRVLERCASLESSRRETVRNRARAKAVLHSWEKFRLNLRDAWDRMAKTQTRA